MVSTDLKFGIPDIELGCASGRLINPSSFAGHELIAFFCPENASDAASELAAYQKQSEQFVERDAWLIAFKDDREDVAIDGAARILTIADPQEKAWSAFRALTSAAEEFDRSRGATFLFTRGGGLHRYWHGIGHVEDVLSELRTPFFEHAHQRLD